MRGKSGAYFLCLLVKYSRQHQVSARLDQADEPRRKLDQGAGQDICKQHFDAVRQGALAGMDGNATGNLVGFGIVTCGNQGLRVDIEGMDVAWRPAAQLPQRARQSRNRSR